MEIHTLHIDGSDVPISIPRPANRPSAFILSAHKAGSTLLQIVVRQLAAVADVPYIDVPSACFDAGVHDFLLRPEHLQPLTKREGYIFSGFRSMEAIPQDHLRGRPKILLVRDPRDMFVSLYFSVRYSHAVAVKGPSRDVLLELRELVARTDIESFVFSEYVALITATLRAYMTAIDDSWRLYRYEDIIFDKRTWVRDMAHYLQLDVSETECEVIANVVGEIPTEEKPHAHVRQVKPGNHKKHLTPETIAKLDANLSDILSHFGYATEKMPLLR